MKADCDDDDRLAGLWPALQPTPGFADRVLAACAAPPVSIPVTRAPRRRALGSFVLLSALAAVAIAAPFMLLRAAPAPAVAAAAVDADGGLVRD
jgi:hypothetical protein